VSWFKVKRKTTNNKPKKPHHGSPMQRRLWEEVKEHNKDKEADPCTNTEQK